jgi:hypothetical protein
MLWIPTARAALGKCGCKEGTTGREVFSFANGVGDGLGEDLRLSAPRRRRHRRQPQRAVLVRRRPIPHWPPRVPAKVAPKPHAYTSAEHGIEAGAGNGRGRASVGADIRAAIPGEPLAAIDGGEHRARVGVQRKAQRPARLEPARSHLRNKIATAEECQEAQSPLIKIRWHAAPGSGGAARGQIHDGGKRESGVGACRPW